MSGTMSEQSQHQQFLLRGTSQPSAQEPTLLQQANDIINGPRANDYGPVKENFERIAALWSVVLGNTITWEQVALCLVQLKVSRLVNSPNHKDSWLDIAGYAGCWEKGAKGQ